MRTWICWWKQGVIYITLWWNTHPFLPELILLTKFWSLIHTSFSHCHTCVLPLNTHWLQNYKTYIGLHLCGQRKIIISKYTQKKSQTLRYNCIFGYIIPSFNKIYVAYAAGTSYGIPSGFDNKKVLFHSRKGINLQQLWHSNQLSRLMLIMMHTDIRCVSLPLITFFFDRLAHVIQSTLIKTLICKKNIKIIIDGWLFVIKGWSKHIRLQNGN